MHVASVSPAASRGGDIASAAPRQSLDSAPFTAGVIALMTDWTGYPPEVLELGARLQTDLDISPAETRRFVEHARQRLGLAAHVSNSSAVLATLGDLVTFLAAGVMAATSVGQSAPSNEIARRYILETVSAPLAAGAAAKFRAAGAVVILGDHSAASLLARQLELAGASVHVLHPQEGEEAVLAAFDRIGTEPPVRHMFLMTALDEEAAQAFDAGAWERRRASGLELPALILQKWGQRLTSEQVGGALSLAAATRMGGDFGFSAPVCVAEGGWIAGVLKSLRLEWNRQGRATAVKVCDFAVEDSDAQIVEGLLGELAAARPEVEVGLGRGARRVLVKREQPAAAIAQQAPPERGAVWVVTGGARGITAEVAIMLGRNYDLNLQLIGRTPAPQTDAPWRHSSPEELKKIKQAIVRRCISERKSPEKEWERIKSDIQMFKNLERMREAGLRVCYHSCDVADAAGMQNVLAQIRRDAGPISGVVHGAGYARDNRIEALRRKDMRTTIDAKISGAMNLIRLTSGDPLRYFIGFGSISGRFGGNGLSDYAGCNDMLAKLCAWLRAARPDCAVSCIDWQSWDEVGMAMLVDGALGSRGVLKMKFLPPSEGVEHLRREICAGLPQFEVLIDDGEFERALWSGEHAPS